MSLSRAAGHLPRQSAFPSGVAVGNEQCTRVAKKKVRRCVERIYGPFNTFLIANM
jgi:hypothetical protein